MVRQQQDLADAANSTGQTHAPPTTPEEKAPVDVTPAPEKKAPNSASKEKQDATSAKTGSASRATKRRKRSAPAPAPDGGPRKVVVREGGAREPAAQIAPGMTPAEAARQRQDAERLLGATDDQLRQLAGSTLTVRQQQTVGQIHNYMDGAHSALKEGDVRRANTLAEKAHLLADDLVKH
ncbi:MAG: hypothetical protein LAO30_15800 [Acidobacteriia bacterium]|nr:hypothetical protein [Terriglobia bacterium]